MRPILICVKRQKRWRNDLKIWVATWLPCHWYTYNKSDSNREPRQSIDRNAQLVHYASDSTNNTVSSFWHSFGICVRTTFDLTLLKQQIDRRRKKMIGNYLHKYFVHICSEISKAYKVVFIKSCKFSALTERFWNALTSYGCEVHQNKVLSSIYIDDSVYLCKARH